MFSTPPRGTSGYHPHFIEGETEAGKEQPLARGHGLLVPVLGMFWTPRLFVQGKGGGTMRSEGKMCPNVIFFSDQKKATRAVRPQAATFMFTKHKGQLSETK